MSDTVVVGEIPFEPDVSVQSVKEQKQGQGHIEGGDLKQLVKGGYNGLINVLPLLTGPVLGPAVEKAGIPKATIDPRYGGAAIMGEQLAENLALDGVGAIAGKIPKLVSAGKSIAAVSRVTNASRKIGSFTKEAIKAPVFMFLGTGGVGGGGRLRSVTFRPVTAVEQAAIDKGAKVLKAGGTFSEAGVVTHEASGAAGAGEGVDFKGKGWILDLKSHWTGWAYELQFSSATKQTLKYAADYRAANGGLNPIRIVKHIFANPSGGPAVKVVGK